MEQQPITVSINFRHSDQMDQVFAALAEAQKIMDGAKKDATNPHFRSKYADLESVMDACRVPLATNGLAILQPTSANGPKVTVTTLIGHKSGQWIAADLEMTSAQNTPQGIGSTITYGRRYGLSSMVGIAPEDDDGNEGSMAGSREAQREVLARKLAEPSPVHEPPSKPKATRKAATTDPDSGEWITHFYESMKLMKAELGGDRYYRVMGTAGYSNAQELCAAGRAKAHEVYAQLATALKEKKLEVSESDMPEMAKA